MLLVRNKARPQVENVRLDHLVRRGRGDTLHRAEMGEEGRRGLVGGLGWGFGGGGRGKKCGGARQEGRLKPGQGSLPLSPARPHFLPTSLPSQPSHTKPMFACMT